MGLIRKNSAPETPVSEKRSRTRSCDSLQQQLEDASPVARRWAARDLLDCPQSVPALVARLAMETDMSVREVVLTTLTRLGNEAAVNGLMACLQSQDAGLRNEAIACMQQLPQEVAPIMQQLLASPQPDLRIFAVNILASLCHPEVESWLIQVISQDEHVNVCAAALDLLAEVGTVRAQAAITQVRSRFADEPYIQFAADLAFMRVTESRSRNDKIVD